MKISNIGIRKFIKDNAPTILSYLAVAGVIGTSVEISKASVKANKKIKEYREKLIELHGTEEDEKIRSEIVRSRTVIASAKPDVRWRREGRSEMTNGEILNKKIADEGITVTFIANKLGCSRNRVYAILHGADATASEIVALTGMLHLTVTERDFIFLPKDCEFNEAHKVTFTFKEVNR